MASNIVAVLLVACVLVATTLWLSQHGRRGRFPPTAPGGKRWIGHVDLLRGSPQDRALKAHAIGEKMGADIFTVQLGWSLEGRKTVIVTNLEHARDLLELNSANTSDRPDMPVVNALTHSNTLGFARYGSRFRLLRTGFNNQTRARNVEQFLPLQEHEALKFVLQLAENANDHVAVTKRFTASTALCATFALPSFDSASAEEIVLSDNSMARVLSTIQPENYVANTVPQLQLLPSFFPGATWKRKMEAWYKEDMGNFGRLMGNFKNAQAQGETRPCFAQSVMEEGSRIGYSEADGLYMAGSIFRAASDTTSRATNTFLMAMILHPETQAKAHAEMDAVVGRGRVPTFADLPNLVYVQALVKECARCYPVAPLAVMHAVNAEFAYKEWVFPKGTWIWPNVWSVNRDPALFSDPDTFNPERYIDATEQIFNPPHTREFGHFQFGYGRRACPGSHFATNGVLAMAMTTLWALRIKRSRDENGEEIVPDPNEYSWNNKRIPFEVEPRFPEWKAVLNAHRREYTSYMSANDLTTL